MRALADVRRDVREMIENALLARSVHEAVEKLKQDLSHAIHQGRIELGEEFQTSPADHYARRLLCRDAALGYSAVVMTWGSGQRTPVHDHGGMWCVEGVVAGVMDVHQYDLKERSGDRWRFEATGLIHANVGSAGCLIPPYEYHVLANASGRPSITLHIYGGDMEQCSIFLPAGDGWYERQSRSLAFDQ